MISYRKQCTMFTLIFLLLFQHITHSQDEQSQSWRLSAQKKPYLIGAAVVGVSLLGVLARRIYRTLYPKNTPNEFSTFKYKNSDHVDNYEPYTYDPKKKYNDNDPEFMELVKASDNFDRDVKKFPTTNNRIWVIAGKDKDKEEKIVEHAKKTYVIIDKMVSPHLDQILLYKKFWGSLPEKNIYFNMQKRKLVHRLLLKRPLMFIHSKDSSLLRTGESISGGFETIGTDAEKVPLVCKDYLSYDEIQVAGLLGISSPTYFINNGNRNNRAHQGDKNSYQEEGVYIGLVGPRLEKPGFMDWQHMIVTKEQNTKENGYGFDNNKYEKSKTRKSPKELQLYMREELYKKKFPTYQEAESDKKGRFLKIASKNDGFFKWLFGGYNDIYLNKMVYQRRLELVIRPFLCDADTRAEKDGKKAYCVVVGLGLGASKVAKEQADYMVNTYIAILNDYDFENISDIHFGDLEDVTDKKKKEIEEIGKKNNIMIHFTKRNPAEKLIGDDKDKLLVAMYEWSGNAYPGNEYWQGNLNGSGDSAAACCSTIAELQNPLINKHILWNRVKKSNQDWNTNDDSQNNDGDSQGNDDE